jgi:hypothetical protein
VISSSDILTGKKIITTKGLMGIFRLFETNRICFSRQQQMVFLQIKMVVAQAPLVVVVEEEAVAEGAGEVEGVAALEEEALEGEEGEELEVADVWVVEGGEAAVEASAVQELVVIGERVEEVVKADQVPVPT